MDLDRLEIVRLELREKLDHAATVVARTERFYLSVAEEIGDLGDLFGGLEGGWVVRLEIVAIGAVKDVDVPEKRVISLMDDLKRLMIAGRNERPPLTLLCERTLPRQLHGPRYGAR